MSRRTRFGRHWGTADQAVQSQHQHIANRRKDFLNKLANDLVLRYDRLAVEDLHISNLVRDHLLSKSILDTGCGYFRQQPVSKAEDAGKLVVVVPPAYTSKTCSQCGHVFESLTLVERWVRCDCGLSHNRDHNVQSLNPLALRRSAWGGT